MAQTTIVAGFTSRNKKAEQVVTSFFAVAFFLGALLMAIHTGGGSLIFAWYKGGKMLDQVVQKKLLSFANDNHFKKRGKLFFRIIAVYLLRQ